MEISKNKENWRKKNEMKVIDEIKVNPAVFYRYAKSKAVIKTDIGPLKDGDGLVHEVNKMAEILRKQYAGVHSIPRKDIKSENFLDELQEGSGVHYLNDLFIDKEQVRKFIKGLSNNSAMGPDGVPVQVLKAGGELVLEAICDLARESLDTGIIPDILKLAWVNPIWKGSDKELASD